MRIYSPMRGHTTSTLRWTMKSQREVYQRMTVGKTEIGGVEVGAEVRVGVGAMKVEKIAERADTPGQCPGRDQDPDRTTLEMIMEGTRHVIARSVGTAGRGTGQGHARGVGKGTGGITPLPGAAGNIALALDQGSVHREDRDTEVTITAAMIHPIGEATAMGGIDLLHPATSPVIADDPTPAPPRVLLHILNDRAANRPVPARLLFRPPSVTEHAPAPSPLRSSTIPFPSLLDPLVRVRHIRLAPHAVECLPPLLPRTNPIARAKYSVENSYPSPDQLCPMSNPSLRLRRPALRPKRRKCEKRSGGSSRVWGYRRG